MAQYGTGRKPHTCWRCRQLFEDELEREREVAATTGATPLVKTFYKILREQGISAAKDWIDARYKKPHKGHKKSWV